MKISLIGMSNSGKTYWAKKLEKKGFLRISCDDFIEERLKHELDKFGYSRLNGISKWMGQPYESRYKENSCKYLKYEREALQQIFEYLETEVPDSQNIVIDTTGSVIYTGEDMMKKLNRLTTIVLLDTPNLVLQEMFKSYIENPKPVIWGESFKKRNGESDEQALIRCYPQLLSYRLKQYKKYAHIVLDYFLARESSFTMIDLLNLMKEQTQ